MGITKTDFFTNDQNTLALQLKALAHPARIAIVEHLIKVNQCICGDLVDALPLAQPTISQHLKELKSVGIIKGSIQGKSICYCLDSRVFELLAQYFLNSSDQIKNQNQCC